MIRCVDCDNPVAEEGDRCEECEAHYIREYELHRAWYVKERRRREIARLDAEAMEGDRRTLSGWKLN